MTEIKGSRYYSSVSKAGCRERPIEVFVSGVEKRIVAHVLHVLAGDSREHREARQG